VNNPQAQGTGSRISVFSLALVRVCREQIPISGAMSPGLYARTPRRLPQSRALQ
jgi:hypothetical protein